MSDYVFMSGEEVYLKRTVVRDRRGFSARGQFRQASDSTDARASRSRGVARAAR